MILLWLHFLDGGTMRNMTLVEEFMKLPQRTNTATSLFGGKWQVSEW
jgi:hypothetical protein